MRRIRRFAFLLRLARLGALSLELWSLGLRLRMPIDSTNEKGKLKAGFAFKTAMPHKKPQTEARLGEVSQFLRADVPVVACAPPIPTPTPPSTPGTRSDNIAKFQAAYLAKWAKVKAFRATLAKSEHKKKQKMSDAAKANIRAAVQARWG